MTKQTQKKIKAQAYDRMKKQAFDKKFTIPAGGVEKMLNDILKVIK